MPRSSGRSSGSFPLTFQRDDERLAAALSDMPPAYRHAIEFRHESWFTDRVWELLREHNVALVIADDPMSARSRPAS